MTILTRYFTIEFAKLFALCQTIFVSIYLIIDFVQKIGKFIRAEASMESAIAFFAFKSPFIIVQMVPVATLISVVVMFSSMKKNNEITALKSCGLNIFKLARPIIIASILLAVSVFLFSELVVPYASSRSYEIWDKEVKKRDPARSYSRNHIWYKGENSIYWISHFNAKEMVMDQPTFYFFDSSFELIKRIDGRKAVWNGKIWVVQDGMIQEAGKEGVLISRQFRKLELNLPEKPETFLRPMKRPEEMSYWQLKTSARRIQAEGYDATRYLVDMNIKLAFPLISLMMVLIGVPIALGINKGGTPLAVSLGVVVCFLYLINFGFARSLGLSGVLPPMFSAWLANVVFLFIGIYMMMRLES